MNTTWTLRIEDEPITLSDGSILVPFVEARDVRTSAAIGIDFEHQHYAGLPETIYPLSEVVFRKLETTRDQQIQVAEQKISQAKIEKDKLESENAAKQKAAQDALAAAEAKAKEDEQKKNAGAPAA